MSQIFIPLNGNKNIIATVPVSDQYPSSEEVRIFLMEVNPEVIFPEKYGIFSFSIKNSKNLS